MKQRRAACFDVQSDDEKRLDCVLEPAPPGAAPAAAVVLRREDERRDPKVRQGQVEWQHVSMV